jgi:hypothetical protein
MPIISFHDFAAGFCAAAGSPVPELQPNEDGVLAFTASVRQVDLTVTHDPTLHADHAVVFVTFGFVPPHRQLEVYRDLLHNNLLLVQAGAPAFSLNPFDDQVILHYTCPLFPDSGTNLWAGLQGVVDGALQWRHALAQAVLPEHPPMSRVLA